MTDLQFEIKFCESILRHAPESFDAMEMLAGLYTRAGRIDEGLRLDLILVQNDPDNPTHRYNLACSLALKHRKEEAVDALREALLLGYEDYAWMLKDEDLKGLHDFPSFAQLLTEFEIARPSSQGR